jgi:TonB family protein
MSFQSHRSPFLAQAFAASLLGHLLLLWPPVPPLREPVARVPLAVTLGTTGRPAMGADAGAAVRAAAKIRPPRITARPDRQEAVAASSASAGVADAEELRGYRLLLARGALAFRQYPEAAVSAGRQGMAEVRIEISAAGAIREQLWTSSGSDALDQSALAMAHHAASATPLPEALRGKALSLTLPFIFDLE